nr:RHS repeat protein [Methylosarcina fibrata]
MVKSTGSDQPAGSGCNASASALTYDANGNVARRTDFNGHQTTYTYDLGRNLETGRTEGLTTSGAATPETRTITTEWHPTFRLPTKITEPGRETAWTYDSLGNVTQKTLKDTATGRMRTWNTGYTYSAAVPGALLQTVEDGPRTDVADLTTTDYYAPDATCTGGHVGCRGQIQKITHALGQVTQITAYTAHGQPETVIDPNGLTIALTYDARQRLLSYNVGGEITQFQYDPVGQLTQWIRPDNSTLSYSYDAAHRLTEISDGLGNRIVYTLDAMGHRIQEDVKDPSGQLARTRRSEYDALSRLARDIGANNQTVQYRYDSEGNLTDRIDPLNHTNSYAYDSLNRLIQSVDPANGSAQNTLDAQDRVTAVTDPRNNTTQYTYDGLNNLIREVSPDRGAIDYTYDDAGNVLTRTDARGVLHTYTYDALNRPIRRVHTPVAGVPATPNTNWTYDQGSHGLGRLTTLADESGNTV